MCIYFYSYKKLSRLEVVVVVFDLLLTTGDSETDRRTNGRTNGRMDGRTDGRADGRTSGRADGRTGGRADGRTGGRADGRTGGGQTGGRADGQTGRRADGRTGGRADGRMGGRAGGRADRWLDVAIWHKVLFIQPINVYQQPISLSTCLHRTGQYAELQNHEPGFVNYIRSIRFTNLHLYDLHNKLTCSYCDYCRYF